MSTASHALIFPCHAWIREVTFSVPDAYSANAPFVDLIHDMLFRKELTASQIAEAAGAYVVGRSK